jgi:hypothetical protein
MRTLVLSIVLLSLIPFSLDASPRQDSGGLPERVAQLKAQIEALTAALEEEQEILQFVHVEKEEINDLAGPHWIIEGANVHVRSGSGDTNEGCSFDEPGCASLTGLGNLVVGYNENDSLPFHRLPPRDGSHNLVVGENHVYTSYGGFVAGWSNKVSGANSTVSGGWGNRSQGPLSSISGGGNNWALGIASAVSGGNINRARGINSSISGGSSNDATGTYSSVSGGTLNRAEEFGSSVSGGNRNVASGNLSWVGGGSYNLSVGSQSAVSGGHENIASGQWSSVSGGLNNEASARYSSVSGGQDRVAPNEFNWAAGSLFEEN